MKQIKRVPILKMFGVTSLVTAVIYLISVGFRLLPNSNQLMRDSEWILADLVHIPQFLIPFLIIYNISHGQLGEYGFNLREDPHLTHKRILRIGILFGLVMSFKYIPQIMGDVPLDIPQPVTLDNIVGHMTFQWIVVGVTEETMFRGLIQTYLMKNLEGTVEILRQKVHIGTLFAAIFWGGFHFINVFGGMPIETVLILVIVTSAIGLLMGYAYQKTRSLLTTIIMHNTIFGVPLTVGYLLSWVTS